MLNKALTVTQVTEYLRTLFTSDPILGSVSITGEISNFKHHYSGHMYFTLKDDNCKIKCVMFRSSCTKLNFYPENGMSVTVSGQISVYERDGQYQVYVTKMVKDGLGQLYIAFEELKKKLESEGLFSPLNKIPIPKYPSKVGVVTSSTGAAIRDIINVISRRCPGVKVLIVPVLVQGVDAPKEIANGIKLLNERDDIDVIITGRGGGSIEELWAFNEEVVARAIYNSRIPVISAVGHETDFTIADFVSDLRAPTPSAGAELAVPDKRELQHKVNYYLESLYSLFISNLKYNKNILSQYSNSLNALSPSYFIGQKRQYLDSAIYKIKSSIEYKLDLYKEKMIKYSLNLDALSPLSVIGRGYSITCKSGCRDVVDNIKKVNRRDRVDVYLKNGYLKCSVEDICEGEKLIGR